MKKSLKISRRYAKALMLLAKEENKVDAFRTNLTAVTRLLCESELESALINPVYTQTQRRGLLIAVLDKLQIEGSLYRFFIFLFDKERIGEIALIDETFQTMADVADGLVRAHISAAVPVEDDVAQKIADAVKQALGRKVVLEFQEDPALIGGIVARLGDYVYDGSVRTQVNNIREALKSEALLSK